MAGRRNAGSLLGAVFDVAIIPQENLLLVRTERAGVLWLDQIDGTMNIGIAGPISTESIAGLLSGDAAGLPHGYYGAPLFGTLIRAMLRRGHAVTAFTTSSDMPVGSGKCVVAEGDRFKIVYCPDRPQAYRYHNGHWGRAVDAFRLERDALRQAMLKHRPDVIHAHWTYEFAMAAIGSGVPHLITCHDAPQVVLRYMPNAYRLVRYFMARHVLARAGHLTAVSPYLKKMIEGYANVPVTVVPNPLSAELVGSSVSARRYDSSRPRIAMVLNGWGRLKNPKSALRAFALLRKRIPGAELHVMGRDFGPGEKAELWAKARGLSDGIFFLGAQPHLMLLARLADCDLFLHPSLEETFGMSVVEAMSLGVPVVGGEHSGAVPWVIGDGGILTDVTDSFALCGTMCKVLENAELNVQLRANARLNAVSRFELNVVATAYEAQYQRALHGI